MGSHEPSRLFRALTLAVALLAGVARADETPAPSPDADAPKPPEAAEAAAKEAGKEESGLGLGILRNVIPIPEIILDPNEGNTYGLMAVWLITDEHDEIKYMVAPDVRYNQTKGVFPSFRLFGYPSPTQRYSIAVGKSTTRDETYEIEFADRGLMEKRAFVLARFLYERDSTERFYGFGNDSPESGESNYTSAEFIADAEPGYWILPSVNVSYRMRIRNHGVQPGQVSSVPFILDLHPDVRTKGYKQATYWQHRLAITYDTRDSIDLPTIGTLLNAYVDGADQHVGSSTSFVAFGFEAREFLPFRGEKRNPILAMRAFIDYLQGGTDTPFWLQNSLGGRRALRGFGGDRFIDFNRALVSAELRTRVYQRRLFGVSAELELAPFVETGQVFRHIYDSPVSNLHVVGGMGVRAVVRPQLVAFVDIGYGSEGQSVFTGIDYPF